MKEIWSALKAVILLAAILFFVEIFSFIRLFFYKKRLFIITYLVHYFNKFCRILLGIRIKVYFHFPPNRLKRGNFFVSNHVSYLDGVILSSIFPLIFIGKSELKRLSLFGILVTLSETVFVNRERKLEVNKNLNEIISHLKKGVNVVLFPEGTSTDGKILPFKSSFFEAPLKTKSAITPVAIRYTKVNSQRLNSSNKDWIYWYGDMKFLPHILRVLTLKSIEVEVEVFPPLRDLDSIYNNSCQRKYASRISKQIIEKSVEYVSG